MRFQLTKVSWTLQRNFTISYWRRDNKILSICKGFGPQLWNVIFWEISFRINLWRNPLRQKFPVSFLFFFQLIYVFINITDVWLLFSFASSIICKTQDTVLEHLKQQSGPDTIDILSVIDQKRRWLSSSFIPYSHSQNCYLLALLASVASLLVFWLLDRIF